MSTSFLNFLQGLEPTGSPAADQARGNRPAVMLVAFEGWNDAGNAASDALMHITRSQTTTVVGSVSDDDYYDFQFSRPVLRRNSAGQRVLRWPGTRLRRMTRSEASHDLLLVRGVEPTYRWRAFCAELLTLAEAHNVQGVVLTGALLADTPHSRPVPLSVTSDDPRARQALNLEEPSYEGPTGIVGVLASIAESAGLPTMSVWAAVPHYVAQAPSPKASYALLRKVEELLELDLDLHLLREDAEAWERGVDELAREDPEIGAYVKQLEQVQDATELPEASGESIAREFERYLRRRGDGKNP